MPRKKLILKNLQFPLLLAVAFEGGEAHVSNQAGGLEAINSALAELYPHDYLNEKTSEGRSQFENDVRNTRKKLVEWGQLKGNARKTWEVTEQGLERLRSSLHRMLKEISAEHDDQLAELFSSRTNEWSDLFVLCLERIPAEEMAGVLARSRTYRDVFVNAVAVMPLEHLSGFVGCAFDLLMPFVKKYHVDPFVEQSLSQMI